MSTHMPLERLVAMVSRDLGPKADIRRDISNVGFVAKPDILPRLVNTSKQRSLKLK